MKKLLIIIVCLTTLSCATSRASRTMQAINEQPSYDASNFRMMVFHSALQILSNEQAYPVSVEKALLSPPLIGDSDKKWLEFTSSFCSGLHELYAYVVDHDECSLHVKIATRQSILTACSFYVSLNNNGGITVRGR